MLIWTARLHFVITFESFYDLLCQNDWKESDANIHQPVWLNDVLNIFRHFFTCYAFSEIFFTSQTNFFPSYFHFLTLLAFAGYFEHLSCLSFELFYRLYKNGFFFHNFHELQHRTGFIHVFKYSTVDPSISTFRGGIRTKEFFATIFWSKRGFWCISEHSKCFLIAHGLKRCPNLLLVRRTYLEGQVLAKHNFL